MVIHEKKPLANDNDLDRLRVEYIDRARRLSTSNLYSLFNVSHLFALQQLERNTLKIIHRYGYNSLDRTMILDLGCGQSQVLLEFLTYGAMSENLHGCDILLGRLLNAKERLSHLQLTCSDGQALPYATNTFNLGLINTVFSSILDIDIRKNIAREMLRVLQPGGMILWYDFWLNPTNSHTIGIRPTKVRNLFPNCEFHFQKITLAPPIARRLVPFSWLLSELLEKLKIFNTHYLVAIHPIK